MKCCTICNVSKSLDRFHKNPLKPDGLRVDCKDCRAKRDKANYKPKARSPKAVKICKDCKQLKTRDKFTKQGKSVRPECRDCRNFSRSGRRTVSTTREEKAATSQFIKDAKSKSEWIGYNPWQMFNANGNPGTFETMFWKVFPEVTSCPKTQEEYEERTETWLKDIWLRRAIMRYAYVSKLMEVLGFNPFSLPPPPTKGQAELQYRLYNKIQLIFAQNYFYNDKANKEILESIPNTFDEFLLRKEEYLPTVLKEQHPYEHHICA